MNASGLVRILSGQMGPVQAITMRRTGSPDVPCPAAVLVGGASDVVGELQQSADRVMLTDRELNAAGWTSPPHHGDRVVYSDGRTTIVQGRAEVFMMESDRVFVLRCLGG